MFGMPWITSKQQCSFLMQKHGHQRERPARMGGKFLSQSSAWISIYYGSICMRCQLLKWCFLVKGDVENARMMLWYSRCMLLFIRDLISSSMIMNLTNYMCGFSLVLWTAHAFVWIAINCSSYFFGQEFYLRFACEFCAIYFWLIVSRDFSLLSPIVVVCGGGTVCWIDWFIILVGDGNFDSVCAEACSSGRRQQCWSIDWLSRLVCK